MYPDSEEEKSGVFRLTSQIMFILLNIFQFITESHIVFLTEVIYILSMKEWLVTLKYLAETQLPNDRPYFFKIDK